MSSAPDGSLDFYGHLFPDRLDDSDDIRQIVALASKFISHP